ncbi:hypothetical protein EVAR_23563_1 [Eumeta japonica]|uniref:Uncharacterized protein n=1 Tax=Eumeta variegata TaxID=151549 RepID=A0A4C1WYK9_EUMVA|nr:hypothetical protein EVAR_23563_1 [Eumeta japonica]
MAPSKAYRSLKSINTRKKPTKCESDFQTESSVQTCRREHKVYLLRSLPHIRPCRDPGATGVVGEIEPLVAEVSGRQSVDLERSRRRSIY